MNVAFLGLGGNIGDRLENLRKTLALLESNIGKVTKSSSVYETEAWGSDSEHKYLNQVVEIQTKKDVGSLLEKMLEIELLLGRKRNASQNSDRTVDLDILLFNNEILHSNNVQIPHPRMHLRKFVLIPLCELSENTLHPVFKKSMKELLKDCKDNLNVTFFTKL